MNDNNEYIVKSENNKVLIQDNEKNDILSYSLTQVAALLGETESSILYYTNIFDDLLKIPITNKELTYSNNDIDKLKFLMKLKDKGLSIKEIQSYCTELTFDNMDEIHFKKKTDTLSIDDFIDLLIEKQNFQYSNMVNDIKGYIDSMKESIMEDVSKKIDEELSSIRNDFKNIIDASINDIKAELDSKDELLDTHLNNISSNISNKAQELADSIIFKINTYENVMQKAYTIEQDMNLEMRKSSGIFSRLLGFK